MTDIFARLEGKAGRITLTRPQALNALTHGMVQQIAAALDGWRDDPQVALVILDAAGGKAFCAGGDVAAVRRASLAGDPGAGRAFWRDEYRLNAALAAYPKPVIALMQGFVMGGGVGLGCHLAHRIVGETTQMAMPEAAIGLIPDVGGTLLLARAPGGLGRYLGLVAARMGPGDAIHAGFADHFVPEADWPALVARLCAEGGVTAIAAAARPAPASPLAGLAAGIDAAFAGPDVADITQALADSAAPWAQAALSAMARHSPVSMAATLALLRDLPPGADLREALRREYRFTWRAADPGLTDFMEGVRARLVDKDQTPVWHAPPDPAPLLAPLGGEELTFPDPA